MNLWSCSEDTTIKKRGSKDRGMTSGCPTASLCFNLPEIMSACVSVSKINIISGILWPPAAYLWPGFCAGVAKNAWKNKTAEWEPSSARVRSLTLPSQRYRHSKRYIKRSASWPRSLLIVYLLFPQSAWAGENGGGGEGEISLCNEATAAE